MYFMKYKLKIGKISALLRSDLRLGLGSGLQLMIGLGWNDI